MQNQCTLTSKLENKKIKKSESRYEERWFYIKSAKASFEHEKVLLDLLLVALLKEKKSLEVSE